MTQYIHYNNNVKPSQTTKAVNIIASVKGRQTADSMIQYLFVYIRYVVLDVYI